jgi:hypothetical protein
MRLFKRRPGTAEFFYRRRKHMTNVIFLKIFLDSRRRLGVKIGKTETNCLALMEVI